MFITTVTFLIICPTLLWAKNAEILISLPYSITTLTSNIINTGPAFDLAVQNVNNVSDSNSRITIKYLYNPSHRTCDEVSSQSVQKILEYYYKNIKEDTCYALVMNACGDETGIASIAKEHDLLLFHIALVKPDFINPKIGSPTGIAISGTSFGFGTLALEILAYYKWYHATVLVEAKTAPFYKDVSVLLLDTSRYSSLPFALELYSLDSSSNETIRTALDFVKQRSRVLILLTLGKTAARILVRNTMWFSANHIPFHKNLIVFINIHPLQGDNYGLASDFKYSFRDSILNAFRSLIFIAYRPAGSEKNEELNTAIAERSKSNYNVTFKGETQPLDSFVVETAYNLVELFATVVNESNSEESSCSGLSLAKRISNRTFNLRPSEIYVGPGRARNLAVNIFGFNTSTMSLQPIGTYDWAKRHLIWERKRSIDWPTVDSQPPPDIPVCGFSGREGLCAANATNAVINIIIILFACGIILMALVLLTRWYMVHLHKLATDWWILKNEELIATAYKFDRRRLLNSAVPSTAVSFAN